MVMKMDLCEKPPWSTREVQGRRRREQQKKERENFLCIVFKMLSDYKSYYSELPVKTLS